MELNGEMIARFGRQETGAQEAVWCCCVFCRRRLRRQAPVAGRQRDTHCSMFWLTAAVAYEATAKTSMEQLRAQPAAANSRPPSQSSLTPLLRALSTTLSLSLSTTRWATRLQFTLARDDSILPCRQRLLISERRRRWQSELYVLGARTRSTYSAEESRFTVCAIIVMEQ